MVRWTDALAGIVLAMAVSGGLPVLADGDSAGVEARLRQIREQLASEDFPGREAGQKELDKIPPAQIEVLRAAAKSEVDTEVKQRLAQRIEAMELHNLLNPPPISIKVTNATLAEVAAELGRALGNGVSVQSASRVGSITLDLHDASFGEVIEQISRQQPINVTSSQTITAGGYSVVTRLNPASAILPVKVTSAGSFALITQTAGQPATGNWALRTMVVCDPRIKVMQYTSMPLVQKLTDQDGNNLAPAILTTPSTGTLVRPVSAFSTSMTLAAMPGMQKVADFRGVMAFSVVKAEKSLKFDLDHLPEKPVETARGTLTIKNENGTVMMRVENPRAEGPLTVARASALTIMVRSAAGTGTRTSTTAVAQMDLSALVQPLGADASIEIFWVEGAVECKLPIAIQDIPFPPAAVPAPVQQARDMVEQLPNLPPAGRGP